MCYRQLVKSTLAIACSALVTTACAGTVNRFILDDAVPSALRDTDTAKICQMGAALIHPIAAVSEDAHLALSMGEGVSAVCEQSAAWEAELRALRTKHNGKALGDARAAEIIDAQIAARRAHARTAMRFNRSFLEAQKAFGELGAECPELSKSDEFAYVFVLVTGTLALLHDSASGGQVGVPLDRLAVIARASKCVDDETWWFTPMALRGAAWAMVPGSGPVDGWAVMDEAAKKGAPSGVRIAVAIEALVANNAGRTDVFERALTLHAKSLETAKPLPDWALLDSYAREITQHQSDMVWSEAAGHRTDVFGRLPSQPSSTEPDAVDPFAGP